MKKSVILFGAGSYAKKTIEYVEEYFVIEAVCDNSSTLWGQLFDGKYNITSVAEVMEKHQNTEVLVAIDNRDVYNIIDMQLSNNGIQHKHVNDALYEECVCKNQHFSIDKESYSEIVRLNIAGKKIFVLTAPSHSNLGDQAQTYCIETLLREKYPEHSIYIYDEYHIIKNYYELLYIIKQSLQEEDLIFLHSGYRLTNLYMTSEHIVEMMGQIFENRQVIFLPQTIQYTDEVVKERVSHCLSDKTVIMCRDELSYENAKTIFPKAKAVLYPDIVTSMIGKYEYNHERSGILLVMRASDDGESLLSLADINGLRGKLGQITTVTQTDTTIDVPWEKISRNRKYYVEKEIEAYSKYQLIITNRYHGTIFALAANTSVMVLPTKDHKITAGLQWFQMAGYDSVYFCEETDEICEKAKTIMEQNEPIRNSDFFYQNYYKDFNLNNL